MPGFLSELQTSYPDIRPSIQLATTDVVQQWIENRTVEFGVSLDNFGEHQFKTIPIYKGRFVFVAHKRVRNWDSPDQVFILPGQTTRESGTFKLEYKKLTGRTPPARIEIKSWGVVKRLAEIGLGIGLIPDYLMRFEGNSALKEVKTNIPPIYYDINAYYSKSRGKLSKQSQVFLNELEKFAQKMDVTEKIGAKAKT